MEIKEFEKILNKCIIVKIEFDQPYYLFIYDKAEIFKYKIAKLKNKKYNIDYDKYKNIMYPDDNICLEADIVENKQYLNVYLYNKIKKEDKLLNIIEKVIRKRIKNLNFDKIYLYE